MAKAKTIFFCKECGNESSKWMGQCPACGAWNSFTEEKIDPISKKTEKEIRNVETHTLSEIVSVHEERVGTSMEEFDRVLGGGIVRGSLILVGGDPGIGKSTLLLQTSRALGDAHHKVLYISGEESLQQIKLRADRMGSFSDDVAFLCETNLSIIDGVIRRTKPEVVIIDSIQTMFNESVNSAPGSVSQVRESTGVLMQLAKGLNITIFVVGHVTKEGVVAGPRVLEHMVDTVLYFEGDRHASYRILRSVKNRFGSTDEIGVFEMVTSGLNEVKNPSEFMLEGRADDGNGSVVACQMEGTRPILMEVQALATRSNFGMPRRTSTGMDYNRVNLLMAVLEKRLGLKLGDFDCYVNIAGGIKVSEPAVDLATCIAIISSYKDMVIAKDTVAFGEVGLGGEVRAVSMADQRIREAKKLGFTNIIMPQSNLKGLKNVEGVNLIGVRNVKEVISKL
ncbi:MAG: DNA repair protein RadA [Lachnospiraceae bacterium]|nr:DNA repair protein RadA [Lachnospiraceae bacterium]